MYDELYEAWKNEKDSLEVQPLPKDFFSRLAQYVKKLREEERMLDNKTVKARLLQRESKNVKKLAEALIQLRYDKVLAKVMAKEATSSEGLAFEEEKIFKETGSSAEGFQSFLNGVLSGRSLSAESREKTKNRVLRFLREVPTIIGVDMKPYGPFKPEDVASVPVENAKALVKQGLATEVEVTA